MGNQYQITFVNQSSSRSQSLTDLECLKCSSWNWQWTWYSRVATYRVNIAMNNTDNLIFSLLKKAKCIPCYWIASQFTVVFMKGISNQIYIIPYVKVKRITLSNNEQKKKIANTIANISNAMWRVYWTKLVTLSL